MKKIITPEFVKSLEWRGLEMFCCYVFQFMGKWDVEPAQGSTDNGIDLTLYKKETGTAVAAVQCKAYSRKRIDVTLLRQLLGSMTAAGIKRGIFITTTSYTKSALEFAENNKIKAFTAETMCDICAQMLKPSFQKEIINRLTTEKMTTPTCVECGIKMVLRTARKGKNIGSKFWGCPNYPSCSNTLYFKEK